MAAPTLVIPLLTQEKARKSTKEKDGERRSAHCIAICRVNFLNGLHQNPLKSRKRDIDRESFLGAIQQAWEMEAR